RPLLDVDRAEVEQYLREHQIRWREDTSNSDPRFARNRIRHKLLPELVRDWNPRLVENLAQTAEWARDEESWWEQEIDRLAERLLVRRNGFVLVQGSALTALAPAAARRLVRRAVEWTKGDLRAIEFAHIGAVLNLASSPKGHGCVLIPGVAVVRSFDWLRFGVQPSASGSSSFCEAACVPGSFHVPGSDLEVYLELIEKSETLANS